MALSSGTKLGPYEIINALGAGGMGEVYRPRDSRLNRQVAVKVLPAIFDQGDSSRKPPNAGSSPRSRKKAPVLLLHLDHTALDLTNEPNVYETGYWVAPKYAKGMATEAANAAIRYAFGHLGAKAISIGFFDGNEASRRIVEKLGFHKIGIAHQAATRCLDGTKLDRHEYILTTPDALPELEVSWGEAHPG